MKLPVKNACRRPLYSPFHANVSFPFLPSSCESLKVDFYLYVTMGWHQRSMGSESLYSEASSLGAGTPVSSVSLRLPQTLSKHTTSPDSTIQGTAIASDYNTYHLSA